MELIQDTTHKYHFYFSIFSPPSFHGIPLKQLLIFMVDSGNPVRETLISHTSQEGRQASDPEPALHRVLFQSQRALRMQRNTSILFTITLFPQATPIMGKVKGLRGMRFQLPLFISRIPTRPNLRSASSYFWCVALLALDRIQYSVVKVLLFCWLAKR